MGIKITLLALYSWLPGYIVNYVVSSKEKDLALVILNVR